MSVCCNSIEGFNNTRQYWTPAFSKAASLLKIRRAIWASYILLIEPVGISNPQTEAALKHAIVHLKTRNGGWDPTTRPISRVNVKLKHCTLHIVLWKIKHLEINESLILLGAEIATGGGPGGASRGPAILSGIMSLAILQVHLFKNQLFLL